MIVRMSVMTLENMRCQTYSSSGDVSFLVVGSCFDEEAPQIGKVCLP